jgi:hypothetical protein
LFRKGNYNWMLRFLLLTLTVFTFLSFHSFGQQISDVRIDKKFESELLTDVLSQIEANSSVKFFYDPSWLENVRVSGEYTDTSLRSALEDWTANTRLNYHFYDAFNVVLYLRSDLLSTLNLAGLKDTDVIIVGDSTNAVSGTAVSVRGTIRNGQTNEPLLGASVYVDELASGTVTNAAGRFSLQLLPGDYHVRVSHVTLQQEAKRMFVFGPGEFQLDLYEKTIQLEGVTIAGQAPDINVKGIQMGTVQLQVEDVKKLPAFLGEVDIIKSLTLLPGVSTVGEGTTGLNVRGGTADQNLILLDKAPVYNTSHLFGFFSIFSPDATDDVTIYKAGIPANLGSRASSVVEVKQKSGSKEKFGSQGGIGLVASRLMVEGPIKEGKSSFIVAARKSYVNYLFDTFIKVEGLVGNKAGFWDLSGKLDFSLTDRLSLKASGYVSKDNFTIANESSFDYQNGLGSAELGYVFSENLLGGLSVAYSDYQYQLGDLQLADPYKVSSGVGQIDVKADATKFTERQTLQFGGGTTFYGFQPGERSGINADTQITPTALPEQQSQESFLYANDEINLNDTWSVMAGLRYSMYRSYGPADVFVYSGERPGRTSTLTDTLQYSGNETIKNYSGLEPRLSLRYSLDEETSLKASYNRIYQYIHLVSNTTAITPYDIWMGSNYYLMPLIADQYSIGYFKNYDDNTWETSAEVYFKDIDNLVDYKDGADLVLNPTLETELIQGKGMAYGIELLVKRSKGKLNGWASYTYSRTLRKMEGTDRESTINKGNWFPSYYDKPHDLTLSGSYKATRRWTISSNFTYSTGRPFSVPENGFLFDGVLVGNYTERNNGRIPDYHRLDLAFTLDTSLKIKKLWESSWTFAVYNVYGRKNAYSVFFKDTADARPTAYKLAILGAAFPSITYNFKF